MGTVAAQQGWPAVVAEPAVGCPNSAAALPARDIRPQLRECRHSKNQLERDGRHPAHLRALRAVAVSASTPARLCSVLDQQRIGWQALQVQDEERWLGGNALGATSGRPGRPLKKG